MQRISTDINKIQRKEQEIQAKKIKDEKQKSSYKKVTNKSGSEYPVHITQEEIENGGTQEFFFSLN